MLKKISASRSYRGSQASPFRYLAVAVLTRAAVDSQSDEYRSDVEHFIVSTLCESLCDLASVNFEVYARRIRFLSQG